MREVCCSKFLYRSRILNPPEVLALVLGVCLSSPPPPPPARVKTSYVAVTKPSGEGLNFSNSCGARAFHGSVKHVWSRKTLAGCYIVIMAHIPICVGGNIFGLGVYIYLHGRSGKRDSFDVLKLYQVPDSLSLL